MENKSIFDKLKKLNTNHWIIIALVSFVLVLALVFTLAYCGKNNGSESDGEGSSEGGSKDPGGTYDENDGYTGVQGTLDPNWDVN